MPAEKEPLSAWTRYNRQRGAEVLIWEEEVKGEAIVAEAEAMEAAAGPPVVAARLFLRTTNSVWRIVQKVFAPSCGC